MDIYTSKENINGIENNTSTLNSWSTLPKRIIQQFKQNDSPINHTNEVYNIDNGVLSIRKKDFPQLEVTIGSKTLERRNRGKEMNSVVLEPLGKTDHLEIGQGILFAEVGLTNKKIKSLAIDNCNNSFIPQSLTVKKREEDGNFITNI